MILGISLSALLAMSTTMLVVANATRATRLDLVERVGIGLFFSLLVLIVVLRVAQLVMLICGYQ